jgi:hypothetical protein
MAGGGPHCSCQLDERPIGPRRHGARRRISAHPTAQRTTLACVNNYRSVSYHVQNEVGVCLIRHVDRHLNSGITARIVIDSRATHDRERDSFAPAEESGTVSQALTCNLSTIEDEGFDAEDIAGSGGISTKGPELNNLFYTGVTV